MKRLFIIATLALSACGGGSDSSTPPVVVPPTPTPVSHTLSFNANGSEGTAPSQLSSVAGQSVKLPAASLTVTGYTFSGWNTQADGRGVSYLPEASISMPSADTILYARFKAPPLKITQQGGDGESRLLVEWPDGSQQDIIYTGVTVGWGNQYDLNLVAGGMAILVPGGTRYMHTNFLDDYQPGRQPVMSITSDGTSLLNATSFRLSDRQGSLAAAGSTQTADEIKVLITGRVLDSDADTEVELVLRADAPRMAFTRSRITYTRSTNIARLYHQLVHASPARLNDPLSFLTVKNGEIIDVSALPTDISGGVFYKSTPSYYVGFVGPRAGAQDFYAWRDPPYYAAYKIIYDNVLKQSGEFTESKGVASWGFSIPEARKLLQWSADLTRGAPPAETVPYAEKGALRMVSEAYQ